MRTEKLINCSITSKYIDAEELIAEIDRLMGLLPKEQGININLDWARNTLVALHQFIDSHQQEQPINMIQWTGDNLQEVIDFTGKSPRFGEWFKSWDEFESYVHSHGDILKLFSEDGSHYEVPAGAWIIKTPDGYNVPSVAKYIQREQPDGIEGVVHHFHMAHYIVTNQEQLTARLRQFPSEAEVEIFIYARKEVQP